MAAVHGCSKALVEQLPRLMCSADLVALLVLKVSAEGHRATSSWNPFPFDCAAVLPHCLLLGPGVKTW